MFPDVDDEYEAVYQGQRLEDIVRRLESLGDSVEADKIFEIIETSLNATSQAYRDFATEGFVLSRDVDALIGKYAFTPLNFVTGDRTYIPSAEMLDVAKRARANLGQRDAEKFIAGVWQLPTEYREFCFIFTGTLWQNPLNGYTFFPCIEWRQGAWRMRLVWAERKFGEHERLLQPRKNR